MKPTPKKTTNFILVLLLLSAGCTKKEHVLQAAKNKLDKARYISYSVVSYWPNPTNPVELVDTTKYQNEFSYNENKKIGYDYISSSKSYDLTYINDVFQNINHNDSIVLIKLPTHFEKESAFNKTVNRLNVRWSPMNLMQGKWDYVQDTVIDESSFSNFAQVEMDTVVKGEKIYVERHIFINPESALLERFERRAFSPSGKISQRVVRIFSDYKLTDQPRLLKYDLPENFTSAYAQKKVKRLAVGEIAPKFEQVSMSGDTISLDKYKNRKVLLNFSVINCGYCQTVLKYINQDDYSMTDEVSVLYINPEDGEEKMKKYVKNLPIPFPIIANAKQIGEKYGVNAYPLFFLIDENGIVEKVQAGYSKDFLDSFKM